MIRIREAINRELRRQGISRYKLARMIDTSPATVYRQLADPDSSGREGFSTTAADAMLEALGLVIKRK